MREEVYELVKRMQQGDQEAFAELYNATYADTFRIAQRLCKDHADASDAVQDTYLEIVNSIHKLREPKSFYVWLSRIVLSKCTRIFRKKRHMTLDDEQIRRIPNQTERNKTFVPNLYLEEVEEQELMRAFVSSLSPVRREVVELVYFQQKSLDETSKILSIPEGTVKSRLFLARKELHSLVSTFEHTEGRRVGFHEACSSFVMMSMITMKKLGASLKQKMIANTAFTSVITNTVTFTAAASVSMLGVQGGVAVYKEYQEVKQNEAYRNNTTTEPMQTLPNRAKFHVSYNENTFTSPKSAYYELKKWIQDPFLIKEADKQEIQRIKPLYDAIKKAKGPFWEMLQYEGWNTVFEKK